MEMQFRIMDGKHSPGGFSWDITVRIASEMGGQLSVIENENAAASQMETVSDHTDESAQLFEMLTGLRRQIA